MIYPIPFRLHFLGHVASDGELTAAGTDAIPYVSIGFYGVKMVAGVRKYRAIWLT